MSKKPYLSHIGKDPDATKHTIEFVRYLGRSFGAAGALNALRYYRDLGWVSDAAFEDLKDHIQGLSTNELSQDTDVEDPADIDEVAETSFGVHAESLRYLSKIAGDDFQAESVNVDVAETRVQNAQTYFDTDDGTDDGDSPRPKTPATGSADDPESDSDSDSDSIPGENATPEGQYGNTDDSDDSDSDSENDDGDDSLPYNLDQETGGDYV